MVHSVVYRPGRAVGIGHVVVSWAGYVALADALGGSFLTTLEGTVLERLSAADVLRIADLAPPISFDHCAVVELLTDEALKNSRLALITRRDMMARAWSEFPVLRKADVFDIHENVGQIHPETLRSYDVVYVDSVLPRYELTTALKPLRMPIRLRHSFLGNVEQRVSGRDYIAVHVRHGNGEHLHGRLEGGTPDFDRFLDHVGTAARDAAGGAPIFCLSDNTETAASLAERTGGQSFGEQGLPTNRFQEWFKDNGHVNSGHTRILADLACLAGARKIVAGYSQFAFAGHILSDHGTLNIVKRDGQEYDVYNHEIGYVLERSL